MKRFGFRSVVAAALLAPLTCAWAADAPAAGSTSLDGLTVAVPRTPPAVVSTYPAAGATVAPGTLVVKVSFDQSMEAESWGYAKAAAGDYPQCLAKPRLLADNRTFVLLCSTAEASAYALALNGGTGTGFTSVGHRAAAPFELKFSTSTAAPIHNLKDALAAAGLKPEDSPIESTQSAAR